ncbi:peptidoglycan-binding protein LysM [Hahella sp. CCB-MM4]|uniref:CIS tube protein n=1 Tax=Hahella sp. (strain CCB-MM4) TaxID=1926491 RepID=UPI000B9A38F2|nr:peptidoglycan-binding protein LysM [Hahella sp. CCB-MM4]OZG73972.1 peptidoglycan-binding protein LysM [Hahella sp. CCB-MM4]
MVSKATIINVDKGNEKLEVMFNPEEYEVITSAKYSQSNGNLQYNRSDLEDFSVSLFFDSYAEGSDIRDYTKKVADLAIPTISGTNTKRPPICLFSWGGFSYRGVVSKVQQKFTMFLSTGVPVRAELQVTFTSWPTDKEESDYSGKEACVKFWEVKSSDRLDIIANETLNNPALWSLIAETNRIEDPLTFPTAKDLGRQLLIPDIANKEPL